MPYPSEKPSPMTGCAYMKISQLLHRGSAKGELLQAFRNVQLQ